MHSIFASTIDAFERAFRTLEADISPPGRVPWKSGFYYRYEQKCPKILVVQKLNRIITGVKAALLLARSGLYQEVGVMFRILDEFGEDVIFISEAVRTGQLTELQQQFLDEFFQPEFDNPNPLLATQKRYRVPRDRIQAAIARFSHHPINPSDAQSVSRTIAKGYSGYVHGTSERILETYDGTNYCLNGMLGTPRQLEFEAGIWEYLHRSLTAVMYACLAFGKQEVLDELYRFRAVYEQAWGRTEWPSPQKLVADIKRDGAG
jgi:hypothetical protein